MRDGQLIANAPHMPVHLGSMSESIKTVIARNPQMREGDVYVLNDPYHGGTHLPDVTVVTPVYLASGDARPSFYVASRGHHADIGGSTPGSMPPFSKTIDEEGVLFDNFLLVRDGRLRESELRAQLNTTRWPARNPDQTIADLRAQIAANEKGVQELRSMVAQFGRDTVAAYMRHVQDNAEESVRRVITALKNGRFELPLDNGATIRVEVTVHAQQREATIDFSGTSAQLPNNFNAPKAVTMAAVLYVFRTLVDDDIPLNAGCLKPLQVIVPEGCMLNPQPPAAVVAGNVETSQCVTNALFGALGVMAASQCTMNNFTFGNETYQYYETISGGSGAGPDFDGASVVQTHMTNSRLTDPEVLEFRFPVRLDSYAIRAGSGGAGRHRGGDGSVRRVRFLEAMTASILSNGRRVPAFGLAGGPAGRAGDQPSRTTRWDGRAPAAHRLCRDGAWRRVRDRNARRRRLRASAAAAVFFVSVVAPALHRLAHPLRLLPKLAAGVADAPVHLQCQGLCGREFAVLAFEHEARDFAAAAIEIHRPSSHRSPGEPALLQAVAQTQSCPVQQHPQVRRRDRQFLTDLVAAELEPLAHHEHAALRRRQMLHADLEHLEELPLVQAPLGAAPVLRRLAPVAIGLEQQLVDVGLVVVAQDRALAAVAAQLVDHLVLQNAHQPCLQLRLAGKRLRLFQRGQHRLGDGVFGPGVVAQLRSRVTQQLWAQGLDLAGKLDHAWAWLSVPARV